MAKQTVRSLDSATPEDRILAAATGEFASNGFFGARTQAIADVAGVNKAMLHYYFRSKENLYSQVIKAAFERILKEVGQAWLGPGPLAARLEAVIDSYMENYERNPGFLKIVLREVVDGGKRFKRAFKDLETKPLPASGITPLEIIGRVASELGLSNAETIHLIINLIGMCAISFVSPLILETVVNFHITDFDTYLKQRRAAIKGMALAYTKSILSKAHKE